MASRPGQAASLLFYFSVLVVAASGVAFGLDWIRAPMPPMPETEASVQAAKLAAHVPPSRKVVVAKAKPRSVYPGRQSASGKQQAKAAAASAPQNAQKAPATPDIMTPESTAAETSTAPAPPQCDIAACSAAYRSFRASDCTWQPYDGPRRLCTKGQPPQQEANAETVDPSQYSDKCDIDACRRAYFTFDPTDCTYQPSHGPRRLCTKGTPPKSEGAETANAPPVSDKCDVEACKRAYVTFDPTDCTYKPTLYGPRALCTKGTPPKQQAKAEPPVPATPPADQQVKQEAATPADETAKPEAAAAVSDKCDIEACKQAYISFNPADCTYQPVDSPRQLCTKGTPPKPETKAAAVAPASAVASPPADEQAKQKPAAPTAEQTKQEPNAPSEEQAKQQAAAPGVEQAKQEAAAPAVSDKCDVEACKRAYVTFDPTDCTYKPTLYGPRALCTKGTPPKSEPKVAPAAPAPPGEQAKQEPAASTAEQTKQESSAASGEQAKQQTAAPSGEQAKPGQAASADQQAKQEAAAPAVSDKCDVEACKRAYVTFDPTDCTYKPTLYGPRALCTKGTPPKPEAKAAPSAASEPPADQQVKQEAAAPADETAKPETPAPAVQQEKPEAPAAAASTVSDKCDITACKQAYISFNPADCTYQPIDGPRRLCTKGTPPKPQAKAEPAAAAATPSAAASPSTAEAKTEQPAQPKVSDKCDVEACKRAYVTFDPADCTYKPTLYGPRQLCTKGTPPKPQAKAEPATAPAAAPPAAHPAPRASHHPVPPGLVPSGR